MTTKMNPAQIETRRLRVYRYSRGVGNGERFDEFDVPVGPHTTVLDALRWIQLHRDPSLTLRYSCLHASCGTCGMQVDGREELACVCSLQDHREQVTVEPLANLPILTDLVVDMTGFFERFPHAHPIIRASEPPVAANGGPDGHHAEVTLQTDVTLHHHPLHHLHRAAPAGSDFMRLEGLHRVRAVPVGMPGGINLTGVRRAGGPGCCRATARRAAGGAA